MQFDHSLINETIWEWNGMENDAMHVGGPVAKRTRRTRQNIKAMMQVMLENHWKL